MKSMNVHILALALLIQCVGIIDHSVWTPDEPREAQIVREMSLSGNYLIPHFAGNAFLEKPPLYYVTAVVMYKMFGGVFPEAGRLASLLFSCATLFMVYFSVRRVYSKQTADLAVLVLATFGLFFMTSHKMITDIGLVFFVALAMCSFLLAYKEKAKVWYKVFWISLALAFLTKGIIGLAIPGAGLLVFILWQRDFRVVREAWLMQGILLLAGAIFAWGLVLYLRGGESFLYTFYVYNQIGRFIPAGAIYQGGHVRPFYFYFMNLPLHAAPWSILLIPAVATARGMKEFDRFHYSWLLGGLLLLSMASTKREIYFLPIYPALAVIIARWMIRVSEQQAGRWEEVFIWGAAALILAASIALPIGYVKIGGDWKTAVGVSILLAVVFVYLWKQYRYNLPYFAVIGWAMALIIWTPAVFPQVDQIKSYKQIFVDMGKIVLHREVVGYQLTENVEALGPFYGGFPVRNIEDRVHFSEALSKGESKYILVLPPRLDEGQRAELASRASLVYEGGGNMRREIELWMMRSSQ